MDKLLLTAFLSSLVVFLTAMLSIVKLVNEKENKTSEYRQSWTDSVRKSLADLICHLNTQASNLSAMADSIDLMMGSAKPKEEPVDEKRRERINDLIDTRFKDDQTSVREMRKAIYHSYALTRLHFKQNDLSFNRIEQKFDLIMTMLDEFKSLPGKEKSSDRKVLKEKIHSAVAELTTYSRDILKTEWESVKRGERAYQVTKKWSVIGGAIMFFIVVSIGVHAFSLASKPDLSRDGTLSNAALTEDHQRTDSSSLRSQINTTAMPSAAFPNITVSSNVECASPQARHVKSGQTTVAAPPECQK